MKKPNLKTAVVHRRGDYTAKADKAGAAIIASALLNFGFTNIYLIDHRTIKPA